MGNSNSQIDFEYGVVSSDYKPVQKFKDARLGDIILLNNLKNGKQVYMREKSIPNPDNCKKTIDRVLSYLSLNHLNLGKIHGIAVADTNSKTNNKPKLFIYFDYIANSLQQVLDERRDQLPNKSSSSRKTTKFFSEDELYRILCQLVDVLEYLQQNSISHGEIRTETCFVPKQGIFMIFNRKLLYDDTSAFGLAKGGDQSVFLTPVAFDAIKKKKDEPVEDKYKADVFSLGMLILECATLKPSSLIYDYNNFSINLTLLSNRLLEVKDRYPTAFYNLVRDMLRLEEDQRPDFIRIKQKLLQEGRFEQFIFSQNGQEEVEGRETHQLDVQNENYWPSRPPLESEDREKTSHSTDSVLSKRPNNMSKTLFKKESLVETNRNAELVTRPTRIMKKSIHDDFFEDEPVPAEPELRINQVAKSPVNGSAEKFTVRVSGFEDSPSGHNLKRRIFDQFKNHEEEENYQSQPAKGKFSKLRGGPGQISYASDHIVGENKAQMLSPQAQAKLGKTKSIFAQKLKIDTSEFSSHIPDQPSSINQSSNDQYRYNEVPVTNTDFSVEQLLQETWERNEKVRDSIDYSNPVASLSSFTENLNKSKPIIQQFPTNFDSTGTLSLPSFRNQESSRFSHRPEVVDLVDEFNNFDRSLIDSIVKPTKAPPVKRNNDIQSPLVLKNYSMTTTNKNRKVNQLVDHRSPSIKQSFASKRTTESIVSTTPSEQQQYIERPLPRSAKKNIENRNRKVDHQEFFIANPIIENKRIVSPSMEASAFYHPNMMINTPSLQENKASIHSQVSSLPEDDFDKKIDEALQRSRQTCELLSKPETNVLNQRDLNFYPDPQIGRMTERIEKLLSSTDTTAYHQEPPRFSSNPYEFNVAGSYSFPNFQY